MLGFAHCPSSGYGSQYQVCKYTQGDAHSRNHRGNPEETVRGAAAPWRLPCLLMVENARYDWFSAKWAENTHEDTIPLFGVFKTP